MRGSTSLLVVLLVSVNGALSKSTQTEVPSENLGTGGAAATPEVSTQLDVPAELKELRDMVVELRVTLKYTQDELKAMEAENAAVKERLVASETKVETLERRLQDNEAETKTEVENLKKNNAVIETIVDVLKTENEAQKQEMEALKIRLAASETEINKLKGENAAQRQELAALKTRLAASETQIENLKRENTAQGRELATLQTRVAASETDVENLEKTIQAAPKVAFSAALPHGYAESGKTDLNLVFSRIITNVGQAYSNVSGFFTAPVRGVYYLRFTVTDFLSSRHMSIRMCKNGQKVMQQFEYDTDGQQTYLTGGVTLQLEVGDKVNMVLPANYKLYDSVNNHSIFSGFLLFPF